MNTLYGLYCYVNVVLKILHKKTNVWTIFLIGLNNEDYFLHIST